MKTMLLCFLGGLWLSWGGTSAVWADVPQLINYQGKLTGAAGELLEGNQSVTFSFFTAAEGGENVWTEEHPAVAVTQGLFNILLGSVNTDTLGEVFRTNNELFLEMAVNAVVLSPRQRMTSAGYALKTEGVTVESGRIKDATGVIMPPGAVISYAGSSAPEGWLICDGSTVSRSTYSDLFTVVGTSYGSGDGSTTFNLPDLRGSAVFGYHSSDGNFDTIGKTGGAKAHQLTLAELPAHTHSVNPPSTTSFSTGDHSHTVNPPNTASTSGGIHSHSVTGGNTGFTNTGSGAGFQTASMGWHHAGVSIASSGSHSHTVDIAQFNSGNAGAHTHTVDITEFDSGNAGSGQAHNNLPPYQVLNFIIKY